MPSLPDLSAALGDQVLLRHLQVSVVDDAGIILYVNDRFCDASGYTRDELIGQRSALLSSGRHPEDFFRTMWQTARSGFDWRGEVANRRKDGSEFWIELTVVPLPGDGDAPCCYVGLGSDITRLVEAEQQFRHSEARFRGLTETISAAVFLHQGERLIYANRAMERISGYSRDELLGMPFYQLARPDAQESLRARAAARLRGEPVAPIYEVPIRTKGGDIRWLEVTATRIDYDDGYAALGTAIDITERRQAEAAQRHIQQVLQQIIDGDPVPTFVIDAEHRVTHWNAACGLITGTPAARLLGTRLAWTGFYDTERPVLADLIVDGDIEARIDSFYGNFYRRSEVIPGAYEAEGFFPRFGTGGRWLFFTAAPLHDDQGRIIGAIETLVDITERKEAEAALRNAHAELETLVERRTAQLAQAKQALEEDVAKREASEAELRRRNAELVEVNARLQETQEQLVQSEKLASIGQLAAGVAHEINNPIGYVQSNLTTLERYLGDVHAVLAALDAAAAQLPPEHPAAQEVARLKQERDFDFLLEDLPDLTAQSQEGIDRVRKIVADLKDFSRLDSGQDWQRADLRQGLDSTLNIVNNEVKYRAEVVRDYGALPEIECLPSQLNQVFLNLLVNAAHAMPDGERGRITLRTGHSGSDADERVWVEVADTGRGIAPEHLHRIFDPFFTTKPVGKGTGLGLSLSYGIVQKHHGQILVTSQPGQGTTFRVVLPVRQPSQTKEGTPP
ncbi:PAS domain S-box protein [Oryzomicrobium sp.]|uniref:PAS domain S-box protein n=1 Tax=Oryzomicrobium sp. TaxID=1911578 RepID=UPI002FE3177C